MTTTTILLVRHGTTDAVGRILAGRAAEPGLNPLGVQQACEVADRIRAREPTAVYTSPIRRALQTAEYIARPLQQSPTLRPGLTELDFGEWTGRAFQTLEGDQAWQRFNLFRSGTAPPAGESMASAQLRIVTELLGLRDAHPDQTVVAVSHADLIRGAIAYFLGMPIELMLRLEVEPGSVSVLELHAWGARLLALNQH